VLEHGEDDRAMLTEAFRVCAPGGWAVFSVPAYHFMWGDHDVAAHHYRRYGAAEIQEKVQEIGFRIHRLTYLNTFLFPISIVFRQSKNLMTGLLRRLGRPIKARSDFRSTAPPVLNEVMLRVFSAEYLLLKRRDLPFGLSIFCIARKA
jgi:SAM-dependent methyltransferase